MPDNGSGVQLVRIHNLAVHNTVYRKLLPDGSGVDIVKAVIFFFRIELFRLDKLGNPALHLRPWQFHLFWASRTDDERAFTAVVLAGQPCSSVPVPGMILHVADNSVFAFHPAVPRTNGIVNVILGQRPQ